MHTARREVRLHGRVQALPPRAFDLLACLLEHHDEVVSQAHLLQVLWPGQAATTNMLAKLVMHVRQAIGDDAVKPLWIKTVKRVGYRLAVNLMARREDADPDEVPRVQATSLARTTLRLALLPIDNLTGIGDLDWIELGLCGLVLHALDHDARLKALPMETVTGVLEGLDADNDVPLRAATLQEALGVECVVSAALRRVATGALQIDYIGYGGSQTIFQGSVCGPNAVGLGEALAVQLSGHLFPEGGGEVHLEQSNTLFNQLYARAMQRYAQRQLRDATVFLQAALLIEPSSTAARLLLLHSMIRCGEDGAWALGKELLEQARMQRDERLEGMACEALMHAIKHHDAAFQRECRARALELSSSYSHESWAIRARQRAGTEATDRDIAEAMSHFDWGRQALQRSGEPRGQAMATANLAVVCILGGELQRAQTLFVEALEISQRHGWRWIEAWVRSHLASAHLEWGEMALAEQQMQQACTLSTAIQDDVCLSTILCNATHLYLHLRDDVALGLLLRRWWRLGHLEQTKPQIYFRAAQAVRAALRGKPSLARLRFEQAAALAASEAAVALNDVLVWWLLVEARAGDFEAARSIAARIESLYSYGSNSALRVWVLHAQAAALHAQGRHDAALDALMQAVKAAPPGLADACVRLAAAWLCLEQDRFAQAVHLVQPLHAWLHEHPLGLGVAAQMHCQQGDLQQAIALQRSAVALSLGRRHWRVLAGLPAACAAGAAALGDTQHPARLPVLPHLLTLT